MAICFSPSSFGMAVAAWVSGATKRYGFSYRPIIRGFFTDVISFQYNLHIVHDNLRLATSAGGRIVRITPKIYLNADELAEGRAWIEKFGLKNARIVGCHPFASTIK